MPRRTSKFQLPSLPSGVFDLFDTSPQVFYPSRPVSCPVSPPKQPRPLSTLEKPLPLPPFDPSAPHPHIDSPLESSASASARSTPAPTPDYITAGGQPFPPQLISVDLNQNAVHLPQVSAHDGQGEWKPMKERLERPPRPRRAQSMLPPSAYRERTTSLPRQGLTLELPPLPSNLSVLSLPTLEEDVGSQGSAAAESTRSESHTGTMRTHSREHASSIASLGGPPAVSRPRRGSSITIASMPMGPPAAPASASASTGPSPLLLTRSHRSSLSLSTLGSTRSRRGSVSSMRSMVSFPSTSAIASPVLAPATVCVSSVAAVPTLSGASSMPPPPIPPKSALRANSRASISSFSSVCPVTPSETLRQRLRSLSVMDLDRTPSLPKSPSHQSGLASPTLGPALSPSTPTRSTARGGGRAGTPGRTVETPTTPSRTTTPGGTSTMTPQPLSPTPTRRMGLPSHLSHRSSVSLPDAHLLIPHDGGSPRSSRPTTTRLRNAAPLSMGVSTESPLGASGAHSRRGSVVMVDSPATTSRRNSTVSTSGSHGHGDGRRNSTLSTHGDIRRNSTNLSLHGEGGRTGVNRHSSTSSDPRRHSMLPGYGSSSSRNSQGATHVQDRVSRRSSQLAFALSAFEIHNILPPPVGSSPGSLVSDDGGSPTTSVESLATAESASRPERTNSQHARDKERARAEALAMLDGTHRSVSKTHPDALAMLENKSRSISRMSHSRSRTLSHLPPLQAMHALPPTAHPNQEWQREELDRAERRRKRESWRSIHDEGEHPALRLALFADADYEQQERFLDFDDI